MTDPLSFLDEPENIVPQRDILSFLDEPKKSFLSRAKEAGEKATKTMARHGAQYGIGLIERAMLPYDIAVSPLESESAQMTEYRKGIFEDIERLQEQKQDGVWDKQDEELLQDLISQIKSPGKAEKHVKTADITSGKLIEKGAKALGYDLEPQGIGEHVTRIAGNIAKPSTYAKGARYLIDKEYRAAQNLANKWGKLERAAAKNPEKQTLLNFAKQHNLTPEETSLLFHSEGKAEYLAMVGKKTKKFKGAVQGLKDKLGKNYEELKRLGKEGGTLTSEESGALQGDLQKILNEMQETTIIGPDTQPVINTLEKAQQKINEGVTVKELINSRIGLGEGINWKNVDRGDFLKTETRRIYLDAIARKNPEIAKRLADTDKAWAKYEKFKDVLDKQMPIIKFKGIKLPASLVEAIAFGISPFVPFGSAIGSGILAKNIAQRIATQMAMNPKFQAPLKNLQHAIMKGATNNQKEALIAIRKMMKTEDPELYEEMKDFEF